ncbi:hypothetical protein E6Q11_00990, partial [Candidatus Dojkabacteria bacterium]
MGITFRHDAAGVVPPSNSTTRKYGQQLVLQQQQQDQQTRMQQQQQKYQGYQAGLDRLFYAGRQLSQNQFQLDRDKAQNQFQLQRDQAQIQAQEAERQQKFMEDARKMSGRFIMDAIENGEYDPVTSRELRQNLVDEAEALGNPKLDATQRAEALAAIRARRATLGANRIPKAPSPSAQEQFEQGVVTDPQTGMRYRQTAKGDYEPLDKSPQQQQPRNAADAFRTDPKIRKQYYDDAVADLQGGDASKPVTREEANRRAMELYDIDQKSFN